MRRALIFAILVVLPVVVSYVGFKHGGAGPYGFSSGS